MDTLTIEIRNPKALDLLQNLADMELITIVPPKATWSERWKKLSDSLPDIPSISEQEIFDEIEMQRQTKRLDK